MNFLLKKLGSTFIVLPVFFFSPAIAGEEVLKVTIVDASNSEIPVKRIEIQSKVDAIKVFDVAVNRGNCPVDTAENALAKMPMIGETATAMLKLSGISLKKKGETLKFGEKIMFATNASCDIIELNIKTSEGEIRVDAE